MKIKTIVDRLDNEENFDEKVNDALNDGWRLTKREVLIPASQPNVSGRFIHIMLYAEMNKP